MQKENSLISCEELAQRINDEDVACVEAVFVLPNMQNGTTEMQPYRLPNARLFDIETIADQAASLPHMAPSAEDFAHHVSQLGIRNDQFVVCYDRFGLFSAGRVWWMFKLFGHQRVAILDGGMRRWLQLGLPVELTAEARTVSPSEYTATFNPNYYAQIADVYEAIDNARVIVDARPAERFSGHAPEPRAGMRAGHMPSAYNVPFPNLVDPQTGQVLTNDALESLFADIPNDSETIYSCGSGITAAAVLFCAEQIGRSGRVYDGSWSEWGADPNTPIEKSKG